MDGMGAQARQDRGVQPPAARRDRHRASTSCVGDLSILPHVRYCITLDSDTRLPRDARAGADRHHRCTRSTSRRFDPRRGASPKATASCSRASASRCRAPPARCSRGVYAGHTGVDPYTTAVSDIYQDLFGEGHLHRQGPLPRRRVHRRRSTAACRRTRCSRTICSKACTRGSRWSPTSSWSTTIPPTRAGARAPPAPLGARRLADPAVAVPVGADARSASSATSLPLISRWKILDNLRRSLSRRAARPARRRLDHPAGPSVVLDAAGAGGARLGTLLTLAAAAGRVRGCGNRSRCSCAAPREDIADGARAGIADADAAAVPRVGDGARHHPHADRAWSITQRRLLEWETAASVGGGSAGLDGRTALRLFIVEMAASPLIAAGCSRRSSAVARGRAHGRVAVPAGFGLRRPQSRTVLSRPVGPPAALAQRRTTRRRLAPDRAKNWHYFETFVDPAEQLAAARQLPGGAGRRGWRAAPRRRTSAWACCRRSRRMTSDSSTTGELVERLERDARHASKRLERHEGHLLNWYDTHTLAPLWPRYVSTVDSGNLVAALIDARPGAAEALARNARRDASAARGPGRRRRVVRASRPAIARAVTASRRPSLGHRRRRVGDRRSSGRRLAGRTLTLETAFADELGDGARPAAGRARRRRRSRSELDAAPLSTVAPARVHCRRLSAPHRPTVPAGTRSPSRAARRALADSMRFGFLYDRQPASLRDRLSPRRCRRPGRLDAVVLRPAGIGGAAGQLRRHRERRRAAAPLVSPRSAARRASTASPTLLSWSATMFEYLMPSLLMRSFPDTLLDQTSRARRAAADPVRPSSAACRGASRSRRTTCADRHGNYQYKAFGVPGPRPQARPGRRPRGRAVRHRAGAASWTPTAAAANLDSARPRWRRWSASATTRPSTTPRASRYESDERDAQPPRPPHGVVVRTSWRTTRA